MKLMVETKVPEHIKLVLYPGDHPALVLIVEPNGHNTCALTSADLKCLIKSQKIDDWFVDEEQIRLFEKEQRNLKVAKGYRIAHRLDAQVKVLISEDRLEARISIVPPYGGKPVSEQMVQEALGASGVVFGIADSVLKEAVKQGRCEGTLVATGIPPQVGKDVQFEALVTESLHKGRPSERPDGSVDYYDLGLFVSVSPGTPLLKRIPPTLGNPGTGVDGNALAPKLGKDKNLQPGPGTKISEEDPNLLVAVIGGKPIYRGNFARVLGKLEVGDVNFETGNIEFDGSVHIRGTIQAGFKVKAGGDIVIGDTAEMADLSAGGSIHFRRGVFGHKQDRIVAKGNIKAKFLNECMVYCEGDIEVEDLIANSSVVCEGLVQVGQKGGKGQIYGGRILATKGVRARILGSVTEMSTVIEVCPSPALVTRHQEIARELKRMEQSLEDAQKSLNFLKRSTKAGKDPRIDSFSEACFVLMEKMEALKQEKIALVTKLHVPTVAKITAQVVHPGVTVSVGNRRKAVNSPLRSFCFDPSAKS